MLWASPLARRLIDAQRKEVHQPQTCPLAFPSPEPTRSHPAAWGRTICWNLCQGGSLTPFNTPFPGRHEVPGDREGEKEGGRNGGEGEVVPPCRACLAPRGTGLAQRLTPPKKAASRSAPWSCSPSLCRDPKGPRRHPKAGLRPSSWGWGGQGWVPREVPQGSDGSGISLGWITPTNPKIPCTVSGCDAQGAEPWAARVAMTSQPCRARRSASPKPWGRSIPGFGPRRLEQLRAPEQRGSACPGAAACLFFIPFLFLGWTPAQKLFPRPAQGSYF